MELYDGATQDAQTLNQLAADLDNGQAEAAGLCRKVSRFIEAGDGNHIDLRYAELQGLTVSHPGIADKINGLALMRRYNQRSPAARLFLAEARYEQLLKRVEKLEARLNAKVRSDELWRSEGF